MRSLITGRAVIASAGAALLAGALAVPQAVLAAPTPLTEASAVQALAADLGDNRTGGVYRDETGRLVIAVTDEATAQAVRGAGGVAEVVKYSTAVLASIHTTFDERIADTEPIPNTSWGVDPRSNQVVVEIFDEVPAAGEKRLKELAADYGDAVRVDKLPGTIQAAVTYETRGGIGIYSKDGGSVCSLGFNVRNAAGQKAFVTAGHCAKTDNDLWWNRLYGDHYLGKRILWDYPEKDYAVIEYRNPDVVAYGAVINDVGTVYEITGSEYPAAGDPVARTGITSTDLVGTVISPSKTVTYDDGSELKNMIETTLCAKRGDSGGPMWSSTLAVGITSAGNDVDAPCSSSTNNERTWYQPVQWVLGHYGLNAF
jgi:hypothetical protein